MITIGVCDDEEYIVRILKEKIQSCLKDISDGAVFLEFFSGEELLASDKHVDLLFLDIDMPGVDGIEAGKLFHAKNKDCRIVMETIRSDRMKEAFFLEAYRFITKPFEDAEIREAIHSFIGSRIGYQKLLLSEHRRKSEIFQYEIKYIQTYDSYTEFIVDKRIMRSEKSLRELEEELDGRMFFRVNKKYIINFKYIDSYVRGILLIAGKEIKVARRRVHAFEERYREYDLRYR